MPDTEYVTTVVINKLIWAEKLMANNGLHVVAWTESIMLNVP